MIDFSNANLKFRQLINQATDQTELKTLEKRVTSLYNCNCLTVRQFQKLDVLIMEKIAKLSTE